MVQLVTFRYWVNIDELFVHARNFCRADFHEPPRSSRGACEAINDRAAVGDRVLLAMYYRYWLRPDLLRDVDRQDEVFIPDPCRYYDKLLRPQSPMARWNQIRDGNFRFVVVDGRTHAKFLELFGIDKKGQIGDLPSGLCASNASSRRKRLHVSA